MAWTTEITPNDEIRVGPVIIRLNRPHKAKIVIDQIPGSAHLPITKQDRTGPGSDDGKEFVSGK